MKTWVLSAFTVLSVLCCLANVTLGGISMSFARSVDMYDFNEDDSVFADSDVSDDDKTDNNTYDFNEDDSVFSDYGVSFDDKTDDDYDEADDFFEDADFDTESLDAEAPTSFYPGDEEPIYFPFDDELVWPRKPVPDSKSTAAAGKASTSSAHPSTVVIEDVPNLANTPEPKLMKRMRMNRR